MDYNTVEEYLLNLPEERQDVFHKLRDTILANIPEGYKEVINYNMLGYVVPHKIYPPGYHCDPKLPLPFINLASQKNYISFYHMGLYADEKMLQWFTDAFRDHSKHKLDMGKSCIRFKYMNDIPYDLIGELVSKMTVGDWIDRYEKAFV